MSERFEPPSSDRSGAPSAGPRWRADWNQTPWNPPGSGTNPEINTPAAKPSSNQQQDPNRNGDQSGGPQWRPPYNQTPWNAPGPAQNPNVKPEVRPTSPTSPPFQPAQPGSAQNPEVKPVVPMSPQRQQTQQPGGSSDNLYDPHRIDIDQGLQKQIGFPGQLIIGGVSGVAFGGPVPWILNKATDGILRTTSNAAAGEIRYPLMAPSGAVIPDSWRERINSVAENTGNRITGFGQRFAPSDGRLVNAAKWYQANFDERMFRAKDLVYFGDQLSLVEDQITKMKEASSLEASRLTPLVGQSIQGGVIDQGLANELDRHQLRVDLLNEELPEAERLVRIRAQNALKPGLFSEAELKLLADQEVAQRQVTKLTAAQLQGQKVMGESVGANFAKGLAAVGLTIVADHYLDKLITGKDHHDGLGSSSMTEPLLGGVTQSWNTNSLLIPIALTAGGYSGKGLVTKALITGGALIGGKMLDKLLPASEHQEYSQYLRPNGVESLLTAGAFLMPVASNKTRLLMLGGAWLAGRVYNMFEGPSNANVKDNSFGLMKSDMKERSSASMNAAIDSFKSLGEKDNYALRLYTSDWLRPDRQYDGMLSAYRGAVILADAFGESRLDKGTLLPGKTNDFILSGKDLDIGGQALRALIIAQKNVERAKQQTTNEMGQDEKGKKVGEDELKQLDEVGKRVNNAIDQRIYGKHDIAGAVNDLAEFYRGNEKDTLLIKQDLDNSLALNRGSADTKFVAKIFRDQACLLLAVAQLKASGPDAAGAQDVLYGTAAGRQTPYNNGQPRGYDGALDAISLAKQLDPDNPDNAQLEAIAQGLKAKLPKAVQDQVSNPALNPLNVNDQVANPGTPIPVPATR